MDKNNQKPEELTEVLLKEEKIYQPAAKVVKSANIKDYEAVAKKALADPEGFWEEAAKELDWYQPWQKVLDKSKAPFFSWFKGGKCNIVQNALDRHQKSAVKDKIAIMAENENGERRTLTYGQLYEEVNKLALGFKKLGIKKGDRLSVYMPNIPEVAITMLACAKIGAVHSVVYAGFSYLALRDRINDAQSKIIVTVDGGIRRGKAVLLKETVDQAIAQDCPSVEKVIVVKHSGQAINFNPERDIWYNDLISDVSGECPTEVMDAEDTLFILYTSGTTAKPKGIVHAHGGYMVGVFRTMKWVFDIKDNDIFWCTADPGWVTGHSYIIYGPLMLGITTVLYTSVPDYPEPDRIWSMVEKYKVSILYTAPTLIRLMMKYGDDWPAKHKMSSLRMLGSVGEPINPEAWRWYYKFIGKEKCPIMDTWWQTETGMFMITPLSVMPLKAGSATKPFPGIQAEVVDEKGNIAPIGKGGLLVIKNPWPAMLKTIFNNPERYKETYWEKIPGYYLTGDIARRDKDGYFWLQGRADDVLKISGHRIGTAEIESALVSHEAVAEAGVIGKPHPVKGETAKAFVILKKGHQPSAELVAALKEHLKTTIGPMVITDEIEFVDKLPKTRSGKIMRRVLKAKELGLPLGDISTLEE